MRYPLFIVMLLLFSCSQRVITVDYQERTFAIPRSCLAEKEYTATEFHDKALQTLRFIDHFGISADGPIDEWLENHDITYSQMMGISEILIKYETSASKRE